jgi:hypothetical protein
MAYDLLPIFILYKEVPSLRLYGIDHSLNIPFNMMQIQDMCNKVRELPIIHSITIEDFNIDEHFAVFIAELLQKHIEIIGLEFFMCNFANQNCIEIIMNSLLIPGYVRNFSQMIFFNCRLCDDDFMKIITSIHSQSEHINVKNLSFRRNEITFKKIGNFLQIFKSFPPILFLDIGANKIKDKEIIKFINILPELESILYLNIKQLLPFIQDLSLHKKIGEICDIHKKNFKQKQMSLFDRLLMAV